MSEFVLLMFSGAAVFQHLTRALTAAIKELIEMAKPKIAQNFFDCHSGKIAFAGPDQCWLWTAYRNHKGYGTAWLDGKMQMAHRAAYEATHGEGSIADLIVRHRCDVPACVNPAHLEIGTHADNVRDRDERGRHHCGRGETHGAAKLTEAEVRTIRTLYVRGHGELGQTGLARRFGVSHALIGFILRRERWALVV